MCKVCVCVCDECVYVDVCGGGVGEEQQKRATCSTYLVLCLADKVVSLIRSDYWPLAWGHTVWLTVAVC